MKEKANTKCPFLISNTDRAGITAIHWWSILTIHPRFEFFFYGSSGINGLSNFTRRPKIVEKRLTGIEKSDKNRQ